MLPVETVCVRFIMCIKLKYICNADTQRLPLICRRKKYWSFYNSPIRMNGSIFLFFFNINIQSSKKKLLELDSTFIINFKHI